ncbi:MAG TPA: DUF1508 domain-containing protein [Solirubrobacteraceae bacterium]|nr:DUF1508 domain-containing protein [Solirubrobacteraceae bacterium]
MATANKKSRASRLRAHPAAHVHGPAPMEFLIFEDNAGSYHWRILAADGSTLGQSGNFASYGAAKQAAQQICSGAASARFQRREDGTGSVDLVARRVASDDDSDAERWLDEGGSFSSEAVAQWPAPR